MTAPLGIGFGSIGIRAALEHLSLPDVQNRVRLAAVCDPVPGRARLPRTNITFPMPPRCWKNCWPMTVFRPSHSAHPSDFIMSRDSMPFKPASTSTSTRP